MGSITEAIGKRTELSHDGRDVAITLAVCLFLATLTTGLRFWLSRRRRPLFSMPESMTLASLHLTDMMQFLFYSYAVATYLILTIGHGGYPTSQTQSWRLTFTLKCVYYLRLAYGTGLGLVKCSILMALFRSLAASSKAARYAILVIMALCISWSLMATLLSLLNCRPLSYNWNLQRPESHCINRNAAFMAVSIIDVMTNAAILVLPLPRVIRTKITRPEKLVMASLLVLGLFVVAITAVRTVTIAKTDFSAIYDNGKMIIIWTTVEWTVALMIANSPVLWPLLDWLAPFHSMENGPYERSAYNPSCHLLKRLRPTNLLECTQTLTSKTAVAETGSVHSSRSIIRGFGANWTEAIGQAQQPDPFLSLEPGEVRVQTEWSVERSSVGRLDRLRPGRRS